MNFVISRWIETLRQAPLAPIVGSFGLSISWLLPNHAQPWLAFHRDAWAAASFATIFLWVALRCASAWQLSRRVLVLLAIAGIPLVQWQFGLIGLAGDALLSACYLLGFALAVWLGENWSRTTGGTMPIDVLMAALATAALVSVGLQLYQIAGLAPGDVLTDIWVLRFAPEQGRPYANLAQPNLLATLLLLGVSGFLWMAWRGWIGGKALAVVVGFLIVGLALTQSRAAMLTTLILAAGVVVLAYRKLVPAAYGRWAVASVAWYGVALVLVYVLSEAAGIGDGFALAQRTRNETRLLIWGTFWEAVQLEPWVGYGWRHTHEGLMRVFPNHPEFNNWYFEQAHNIFLDLLLWCGIPLGGLLSAAIAVWYFRQGLVRSDNGRRIVLGAITAVGIHSLVELPLYYAYFLLPTGIFVGYLNQTGEHSAPWLRIPKFAVILVAFSTVLLTALIVLDYLKVEERFAELRFELNRVGKPVGPPPDDLIVLTQWQPLFTLARQEAGRRMSDDELRLLEAVALTHPSEMSIRNLVYAYGNNGKMDQAEYWAKRLCLFSAPARCAKLQTDWRNSLTNQNPAVRSVPSPGPSPASNSEVPASH